MSGDKEVCQGIRGCVRGGDCTYMMDEGMQSSLAPDPEEEGLCHKY